jgi:hypothetical protein
MVIGISLVNIYANLGADTKVVQAKSKLIYMRLLDIILKLDNIPNHDEGDEFLELKNLNTELRLG